jgi:hypothetical protein
VDNYIGSADHGWAKASEAEAAQGLPKTRLRVPSYQLTHDSAKQGAGPTDSRPEKEIEAWFAVVAHFGTLIDCSRSHFNNSIHFAVCFRKNVATKISHPDGKRSLSRSS